MNKKHIYELLKGTSPNQLLVVSWKNKLVILNCPFEVLVKYDIDILKQHQIVLVDKIKVTSDLINVYMIKGKGFYYFHFDIIVVNH